jgi:hypothetical protein
MIAHKEQGEQGDAQKKTIYRVSRPSHEHCSGGLPGGIADSFMMIAMRFASKWKAMIKTIR